MNHVPHSFIRTALAGAGALLLAGCSKLPSSPSSNAIENPAFVRVVPSPQGTYSSGPGPQYGEREIDGAAGGELKVGRFTVRVPARTWQGLATISISVPDPNVVMCELNINPQSANHFAVPVTLNADCSGTNALSPEALKEIWYDEAAGVWREVPGSTPIVVDFSVQAPLTHFSLYGVVEGKAGW